MIIGTSISRPSGKGIFIGLRDENRLMTIIKCLVSIGPCSPLGSILIWTSSGPCAFTPNESRTSPEQEVRQVKAFHAKTQREAKAQTPLRPSLRRRAVACHLFAGFLLLFAPRAISLRALFASLRETMISQPANYPLQFQIYFLPRFHCFINCIDDLKVFYSFFTINRNDGLFALQNNIRHFFHLHRLMGDMRLG